MGLPHTRGTCLSGQAAPRRGPSANPCWSLGLNFPICQIEETVRIDPYCPPPRTGVGAEASLGSPSSLRRCRLSGPLSAGRRRWFVVTGAVGSLPAPTRPYLGAKHVVCTWPVLRVWLGAHKGWPAVAPLVAKAGCGPLPGQKHQELFLGWVQRPGGEGHV